MTPLGAAMAADMAEQPAVLGDLVKRRAEIVRSLAGPRPTGIVIVARGSSDYAAVFGRYLFEAVTGTPVALAAPSLQTLYGVEPRLHGWLAVGISQSGRTPEIATVLERFAHAGARTVAITNDPASPLAEIAAAHVALGAGEERAVPATKTFTAELAALALIAEALGAASSRADSDPAPNEDTGSRPVPFEDAASRPVRFEGAGSRSVPFEDAGSRPVPFGDADWRALPDAAAELLADPEPAARAAATLGDARELVCVARGYLVCVALEAALKLREAAGVRAEGWSSADFRHGPVTVARGTLPVLAISAAGPAATDVAELAGTLAQAGSPLLRLSDGAGADLPLPTTLAEPLMTIPAAIRAQQLALAVARQRGIDPDTPPGLNKVTPTV